VANDTGSNFITQPADEVKTEVRLPTNLCPSLTLGCLGSLASSTFATLGVTVEDPHAVAQAISWYGSGFDSADARHLTSGTKADRFVTFDNALAKRAQQVSSIPVARP